MKTIHDFGSNIGGARKDVWVKRGLCVEDTKNMTASEKEKYIKLKLFQLFGTRFEQRHCFIL